ncbi:type VI secretion system protein TssA [Halodesulfovibrio aestuarii]|uniref:type VI secretion system protein TssA n=1 Tax=Halodesulfovibrio aestuarii TaxID=126333 RepID=UPI0003FC7455
MDLKKYRARITQPISENSPVGERLLDDSLLDFVESQMMKIGSLAHADVQWGEAENSACTLLEKKTKDLKILTYLLQCLQHKANPESFTLSVYILADFIKEYWESCYPAPGPRGALPRRKYFSQIMQRTVKAAETLDGSCFGFDQKEELEEALSLLEEAVKAQKLSVESVDEVNALVRRKLSLVKDGVEPEVAEATAVSGKNVIVKPALQSPSHKLEIDNSSDRAVKQTLLKVADLLSELDEGQSLSLRLRRFAVWFSITAAPEADSSGATQLMPVSVDRTKEYEEQLQRGADLALWRKVEKSLTVAPFWLDGHYLSYRVATKLGKKEWAEAIHSEVRVFISRLPSLLHLSFKGGIPFANQETLRWLNTVVSQESTTESGGDWSSLRSEALELAEEGGVSVALARLNEGLSTAEEPRDKFYWRMLSADVMHAHQLSAIAHQEYENLLGQISSLSVTDWEPSLIQRLATVVTAG